MEHVQRFVNEANNQFKIADHLIYVTYGLLKDQRLMFSIINNLYISSLNILAALIYYEKIYKQIDSLPLDIDSRIKIFEMQIALRYNIKKEIINVVKELRELMKEHKDSPLEFARKEKLIICNDNYSKINVVDIIKLKYYASNIKELLEVAKKLENV